MGVRQGDDRGKSAQKCLLGVAHDGVREYIGRVFASLLRSIPSFFALSAAVGARWPSVCRVCRRFPSTTFCADCRRDLAPPQNRCALCALPGPLLSPAGADAGLCAACLQAPPPLRRCWALVDYAPPWDAVVARFKYGGEPALARPLAAWMRGQSEVQTLLHSAQALIPMPLSRERLAQRGYNQALELARGLQRSRTQSLWLQRVRHTPEQRLLDKAGRQRNVQAAFAVPAHAREALLGAQVLLVDDVMTSGASLFEAARTLLQAGAQAVDALVFARTRVED